MANPVEIEFEAPKMLYGPRGWADLDDYRLARNAEEEAAAARDGYFRAGEEAREDLVAAGKWHKAVPPSDAAPLVGVPTNEPPKRRGRPPKTERR